MTEKQLQNNQQHPKLFSTIFSVIIFIVILSGIFLLVSQVYAPEVLEVLEKQRNEKLEEFRSRHQGQTDSESMLTPFVRGALEGVKSSTVSSAKKEEGIILTSVKGFGNGVKAAVITSLDWYDLDRELFESNGLTKGVTSALEATRKGDVTREGSYSTLLIEQLRIGTSRSIAEVLENAGDRKLALDSLIQDLNSLYDEANGEISHLTSEIQTLQPDLASAKEDQRNMLNRIKVNGSDISNANVETLSAELGEVSARIAILQARLDNAARMRTQISDETKKIPPLLRALQLNYDVLWKDVKVAPVQGVNLPIYKSVE